MSEICIIPQKDIKLGECLEFGEKTYKAEKHFSQGKDMVNLNYSHIMYSNKGAFGMVEA